MKRQKRASVVVPAVQHRCTTFEEACGRCAHDALGREDRIIHEPNGEFPDNQRPYWVVNHEYWVRWFNSVEGRERQR